MNIKIKVKDLKPNPFRHLENYKIDGDKVEHLKSSINSTGFWDNVIARKINDEIQIAYGHHRRAACLEIDPNMEWNVPIKPLSDADMIRIMADENLNEWAATASVIDETISAVRDYLKSNREELATIIQEIAEFKARGTGAPNIEAAKSQYQIAWFLGWRGNGGHAWNPRKCKDSLSRIEEFDKEDSTLNKEAVYEMPTATHSSVFQQAVSTAKKRGFDLTHEEQKDIVDEINEEGLGKRAVKQKVQDKINEKRAKEFSKSKTKVKDTKRKEAKLEYDFLLKKLFTLFTGDVDDSLTFLIQTAESYKDINDDNFLSRVALVKALEATVKKINKFTNILKSEEDEN